MYYIIKKPNLNKIKKDELSEALLDKRKNEIFDFVKRVNEPEYLYWDKVQYKKPIPINIKPEILWMIVKFIRESSLLTTDIKDINNKPFKWYKLPSYEAFFHNLDLNFGGKLAVTKKEIDIKNKQRFISRGIMEEAIASSQLEGAVTSRRVAKKMIKEGRKPRNESEQMILNNYKTILALEEDYKDKEMNMALLLELHSMITKNTKDSDGQLPKLRNSKDVIYVTDRSNGEIYHEAPDIHFVKKELINFIKFANDDIGYEYFIHPVIRAIILHFWLGYLHPFTDGNGRLARLLFYWYLLKHDYWAFAYLPISAIIKKSPIQYKMAYIYSEQDENDLTYFINYNIKKIKQAMADFQNYIEIQSKNNQKINKEVKAKYKFNERQIQVMQYFCGDLDERTNMKTHINIFQVAKMTAIKDLRYLEKKGFLFAQKEGRNVFYYPTEKIKELFKKK
jgi:Fic family protein